LAKAVHALTFADGCYRGGGCSAVALCRGGDGVADYRGVVWRGRNRRRRKTVGRMMMVVVVAIAIVVV